MKLAPLLAGEAPAEPLDGSTAALVARIGRVRTEG